MLCNISIENTTSAQCPSAGKCRRGASVSCSSKEPLQPLHSRQHGSMLLQTDAVPAVSVCSISSAIEPMLSHAASDGNSGQLIWSALFPASTSRSASVSMSQCYATTCTRAHFKQASNKSSAAGSNLPSMNSSSTFNAAAYAGRQYHMMMGRLSHIVSYDTAP